MNTVYGLYLVCSCLCSCHGHKLKAACRGGSMESFGPSVTCFTAMYFMLFCINSGITQHLYRARCIALIIPPFQSPSICPCLSGLGLSLSPHSPPPSEPTASRGPWPQTHPLIVPLHTELLFYSFLIGFQSPRH